MHANGFQISDRPNRDHKEAWGGELTEGWINAFLPTGGWQMRIIVKVEWQVEDGTTD
jgi:hypothetical protein